MNIADNVVNNDLQYICNTLMSDFKKLNGKKLLITGGAGFLGYYLIQTIIYYNQHYATTKPVQLTIYDNFKRGKPAWLTMLEQSNNLKIVEHNVINPLPEDIDIFNYIIHAAGIASPIIYRKFPLETIDANISGLRYLLNYSRKLKEQGMGLDGFLFFSSSEIYGDPPPDKIPTDEEYRGNVSCTGPRACYDESKRLGDTLCYIYASYYDVPVKMARPFNNYGPGLKITDGRVIPDFARNILANQDIKMYSDGSPKRTFAYIADVIIGYYKVMLLGKPGEAYNIGVEEPEISMYNLAIKVVNISRGLFNYQGTVVREESKEENYLVDNPNRRCPSIRKAREHLGYNPTVSLDEGLKRSLIWYSENRTAEEL